MAQTIALNTRHFTTINNSFAITLYRQLYRGVRQFKLEINGKGQKIKKASDWTSGPLALPQTVIKLEPLVKRSLPIIEQTDENAFLGWACSTFILKDGRAFPQYLPEKETEQILRQTLARHDKLWLTDGADVYCLPASEVAALVIN